MMMLAVVLTLSGLLFLYYGAESLVTGSSRLALAMGVRPLVVGLTVVAFATSMPELMVSLFAAIKGSASIAAGNIVGSNIANIALILGAAALLHPLVVARSTMTREIPMMIVASVAVYLFASDGVLSFMNGLVLFAGLLVFIGYCVATARAPAGFDEDKLLEKIPCTASDRRRNLLLVLFGIFGLAVGAELMVRGAVMIASRFGISEVVIGLSVVAIGTSLPELAASMMSAWKGEMDISVGNVIGSNIFNVLFVLGICPMVRPLQIESRVLLVDFPVMLGFCALLVVLLVAYRPARQIDRGRGLILLTSYAIFIGSLFLW